jgi:Zn-dependent protease with chaperone function
VPSVAVCAALEDIPARYRVAESRLGELALPERNSACAGALRPEVFVTTGLVQALPRDELAAVLAHEFSHARRHDNLLGLVARSCVILAAFMPSAVYFARRWGRDSELAADEWAYEALGRPEALVRAMATAAGARQLAEPGRAAELVAAVGGGEFAAERVLRLHAVMTADPEGPSGVPASVRRLAAVLATLGVLGVTVAAWDSVDASLRCLGQSLLAALG